MTKYRKGSDGAASEKQIMALKITFTIITLLVFMANYYFNTDLCTAMHIASGAWNVTGVVFYGFAIVTLWFTEDVAHGRVHPIVLYFGLLALAVLTSTGFFSY